MDTISRYGGGLAHCVLERDAVVTYFGSIFQEDPQQLAPVATQRNKQWTGGQSDELDTDAVRLWRVTSTVREIQRVVVEGSVSPLTPAQIIPFGLNRTLLKLAITATDMGSGGVPRRWLIDAGGSLEFWAQHVVVQWLAPPDVDDVNVRPGRTASGLVIDGQLGVKIIGIEAPLGGGAVLTDSLPVTAAVPGVDPGRIAIPIPRGARDVTVYQASAGTASVAWNWFYADPLLIGNAVDLGELPFIAGQRRTHTRSVVPAATHLVSEINNQSARLYTVAWTIQP